MSGPSADTAELLKDLQKELGTISLNISVKFSSIPPMTASEKRTARSRYAGAALALVPYTDFVNRLRALDLEEAGKQRKEEARNTFESYLYRLRDLLDEENKGTPFKKCSQETERKSIAEKLEESFTWLHDKGDSADTAQFLDKRNALE